MIQYKIQDTKYTIYSSQYKMDN